MDGDQSYFAHAALRCLSTIRIHRYGCNVIKMLNMTVIHNRIHSCFDLIRSLDDHLLIGIVVVIVIIMMVAVDTLQMRMIHKSSKENKIQSQQNDRQACKDIHHGTINARKECRFHLLQPFLGFKHGRSPHNKWPNVESTIHKEGDDEPAMKNGPR